MRTSGWVLPSAVIAFGIVAITAGPAAAQQRHDRGADDREIRIGNTMPYTGPAAAYGAIGKTIAAYFEKVNAEGGVNGRKLRFISYDDSYNPQKTVDLVRKLVEEDRVLFTFATLGTAMNAAIRQYMNANKVPQLFVASGATMWDNPKEFPWTMGWQPSYQTEGRIYAHYLLDNHASSKIGILYQNDDYGKDYVKGLKDGLAGKMAIVAEVPYETTETNLNAQIARLKASGADVLFDVTTPKFATLAIRRVAELGWKPLHILNNVSISVGSVLKPAGLENATGILSAYYLKDPSDPRWRTDPRFQEWLGFMNRYLPDGDKTSTFTVYGYSIAQTLVEVIQRCGDDLTRENIMKQAASLKAVQLGMLIPDIAINTSAADFAPIEQMILERFNGERWEPFGPVLSGIDPGAVSEGFKAIFRYGGGATRQTSGQVNANTVAMMTGTYGGTYVQIGADLATVLDDGDNLRLLPVVGRGSVQAVADILFLRGIDAGIVRTDTLDYLEKKGYADNVRKQLAYITKLYNEEMHVVAPKSVRSLADLDGRTVAVDLANGGTFVTAISVFERLGLKPNFIYVEQRVALEMLRKGEIDAVIAVEGKPLQSLAQIDGANLHFVPIDYSRPLTDAYLPAQFTSEDYPNLIERGDRVDTIAAAAVLAAYNWTPSTERYRRLGRLVDAFFSKIKQLQQPPFHPKWRELTLQATLPGWVRFRPAQEWLDRNAPPAATAAAPSDPREQFQQFLTERRAGVPGGDLSVAQRDALFREFLEWRNVRRTAR
jgi:branched-chain amino acid transport system substrate-binding protein